MKNRTYIIFILIIVSSVCFNYNDSLIARTGAVKTKIAENKTTAAVEKKSTAEKTDNQNKPVEIVTEKITNSETPEIQNENTIPVIQNENPGILTETTPSTQDRQPPAINNEKNNPLETEQAKIKAEEIADHPGIILNAYKEAYPHLITDVIKGDEDWIVKFKNGNTYHWAEGKLLPEKALPHSNKYTRYTIYPYNLNGRFPELYTKEKIEQLRVKEQPGERKKKKIIPGVEGGLYRELYSIANKKSADKQLVKVKLAGHYTRVHKDITEKISSIDSKIRELSKTDTEVRNFLKSIGSVQGFNWRKIAGTDRMSNHSYGIAIDILPKKSRKKILYWLWEQTKNDKWMLLPQSSLWTPPDSVVKIFLEEGFVWGGHWDRYDTMHFEYRPELIVLSKSIKFE
jgi:phage-related protein